MRSAQATQPAGRLPWGGLALLSGLNGLVFAGPVADRWIGPFIWQRGNQSFWQAVVAVLIMGAVQYWILRRSIRWPLLYVLALVPLTLLSWTAALDERWSRNCGSSPLPGLIHLPLGDRGLVDALTPCFDSFSSLSADDVVGPFFVIIIALMLRYGLFYAPTVWLLRLSLQPRGWRMPRPLKANALIELGAILTALVLASLENGNGFYGGAAWLLYWTILAAMFGRALESWALQDQRRQQRMARVMRSQSQGALRRL